jgi:hypothetical protein
MEHLQNRISLCKKILRYGGRLLCSPFVGAYAEMKAALQRPRPMHWQEWIVEDIRNYFAPLTGAIKGVRKALLGTSADKH